MEAGAEILIASAITLAIITAIQFGERGYRYRRLANKKYAGTYGFKYEGAAEGQSQ